MERDENKALLRVTRSTVAEQAGNRDADIAAPKIGMLHVGRCGGTSLHSALIEGPDAFKTHLLDDTARGSQANSYNQRCARSISSSALSRARKASYVGGHIPLDAFYFLERSWIFTVLRCPIDRLFSDLAYTMFDKNPKQSGPISSRDLRSKCADLLGGTQLDNVMLRAFLPSRVRDITHARLLQAGDLDLGKANMCTMDHVGFLDDLDSTILQLQSLGFAAYRVHLNSSRDNRTEEVRELVLGDTILRQMAEERTHLDDEIWILARSQAKAARAGERGLWNVD